MSNTMSEYFIRRYGEKPDLGSCVVGRNLNLTTVRGHARLDVLATVSAPDVYDQKLNPTGTQRALKPKHARECFGYAMNSLEVIADEEPHAFPELLFNVRDENVVELYSLDDPDEQLEFDSLSEDIEVNSVGVRINLKNVEFPKRLVGPQISRVDGNHRLHEADGLLAKAAEANDGLDREFPEVAFALLLNLSPVQEARLFRDINGEHEGMETAHLDTIIVRITDPDVLRSDRSKLPLWIAYELTKPGMAFDGQVFFGGSKAGVKQDGGIPPLKINSLKTTISQHLKAAPFAEAHFAGKPDALLELVNRYWQAVAQTFPDAWTNKRDFILLQAIGLGAFAKLGGTLTDIGLKEKTVAIEDFARYLEVVRERVPLERDHEMWKGVAGAGGQAVVAHALLQAAESDLAKIKAIEDELITRPTVSEKLAEAADGADGDDSSNPAE